MSLNYGNSEIQKKIEFLRRQKLMYEELLHKASTDSQREKYKKNFEEAKEKLYSLLESESA